jgi:hypothetical protein
VTPENFRVTVTGTFSAFWFGQTLIAEPNELFDPNNIGLADVDAFVRIAIQHDSDGRTLVSASEGVQGVYQQTGVIAWEVRVRVNQGAGVAYLLADSILEWLEKQPIPETILKSRDLQEIGPDGSWYQINVSVRFVYWAKR